MTSLLEALCALFVRHYPQTEFTMRLNGVSTAMPALASDACTIAVMSRAPRAADRASFKSAKGYAATAIAIAYAGHGPRPGARTPPALYVHADNPLSGLSMPDVARIFSSGAPQGDINLWHQLGLAGAWTDRRIHLYGLRDDGRYASGFREAHLAGRAYPFTTKRCPTVMPWPMPWQTIRSASHRSAGWASDGMTTGSASLR